MFFYNKFLSFMIVSPEGEGEAFFRRRFIKMKIFQDIFCLNFFFN